MKTKKYLNFSYMRQLLSSFFNKIPEQRQRSKVNLSVHDAMMSGFACMYFQDPSLLQFQMRMKVDLHRSNLATLFGVKNIPKETQMREIIDNVDSEYFRAIFKAYYLMLQRNKYLVDYQLLPPSLFGSHGWNRIL